MKLAPFFEASLASVKANPQKLKRMLLSCVLFLSFPLAAVHADVVATQMPTDAAPPSSGSLGVEGLVSQAEVDLIWNYGNKSNDARNQVQADYKLPASSGRDAKIEEDRKRISEVDDAPLPAVQKLVKGGFWLSENRNAMFDLNVWLLIQHELDQSLRKTTLEQTHSLVEKGLFSGQLYGTLYDRVVISEGKSQRFGSQVRCVQGKFEAYPIEDASKVDSLRHDFGFPETLEVYLQRYAGMGCGK